MKKIVFLFLLKSALLSAQTIPTNPNTIDSNHLKQGKWTVWFDESWNKTSDLTEVAFYRIIEYKDGKPFGPSSDYFRSGTLQFEGNLLSDEPEDEIDYSKPYRYYYEDGTEDVANTLSTLSLYYQTQGDYKQAVACLEKAVVAVQEKLGSNHNDYAAVVCNLGNLYAQTGNYEIAEQRLLEALHILEKDPATKSYSTVLNNLAELYRMQGNFPQAEPLYIKALEIESTTLGREHPEYATTLNNLATLYSAEGNYSQAEKYFLETIRIKEKSRGDHDPEYGICLGNLGELYLSTGYFDKAEPLLQKGITIIESTMGKDNRNYASLISNLASVFDFQKKYAEAEKLQTIELELTKKMVGDQHPDYALSLNNAAWHYLNQKQYQKAEPLFLEALRITEKVYGRRHADNTTAYLNLAELYSEQGLYAKAEPYFREANSSIIFQIENYFPSMAERQKLAFLKQLGNFFDPFYSFCLTRQLQNPSITSLLYDNQLLTKAILFSSNNAIRNNIMNSHNDNLIQAYHTWKSKKDYLAKAFGMSIEEKEQENINEGELEEEVIAYEKELARSSQYFAKSLEAKKVTWQNVQAKLKEGEAAVEMMRFTWHNKKWTDTICYVALVITPRSVVPDMVIMKNGKQMEDKYIHFYRNSIVGQKDDDQSYGWFWKTIGESPALRGIRKIYFSPDGIYNLINLTTLFNTTTGRYLFEEIEFQLVSNTKNILVQEAVGTALRSAYLFGYPDYVNVSENKNKLPENSAPVQTESSSRAIRSIKADPLPGTKVEVTAIAQLFKNSRVKVTTFTDRQATEDELKKLKSPQVLHIATHGYFLKDEEDMKGSGGISKFNLKTFGDNPLLRSGLLLAGAQQTIDGNTIKGAEDGLLTAYEAMSLDLEKTDLVVLSACETGLGTVQNGEGVYGLQRAFQNAGAKTVIMSLWVVSDKVTEEFMTVFYSNLLKSNNKRKAFNLTQQTIKAKYKAPFFWGAFVIVGE